ADLLDHLRHLVAACCALGDKTLSLAVQVALGLGRGHPRVDCSPLGWRRLRLRLALGTHDGMRPNPPALDCAVTEPAPGRLVPHAHLFCILRELQVSILPDCERIINDSSGFAMNPASVPNTCILLCRRRIPLTSLPNWRLPLALRRERDGLATQRVRRAHAPCSSRRAALSPQPLSCGMAGLIRAALLHPSFQRAWLIAVQDAVIGGHVSRTPARMRLACRRWGNP